MAIEQALTARGVALVRAKVGDRYILEELLARGWQLGGENSGHGFAIGRVGAQAIDGLCGERHQPAIGQDFRRLGDRLRRGDGLFGDKGRHSCTIALFRAGVLSAQPC